MGINSLEKFIKTKKRQTALSRPQLFNLQKAGDRQALWRLSQPGIVRQVVDDYEEQLKEYFQIMNPTVVYTPQFGSAFADYLSKLQKKTPLWQQGRWVYYPWLSTVVHILEEVGKVFNVTRERIRQIEAKALEKIRSHHKAEKLKGY